MTAATYAAPVPVVQYVAPTTVVTYAALASVDEHVAPTTAATYAAPALVVEYVASTTTVSFAAPAPVVEYVAPTTEVTYAAPAPAVETTVCAWLPSLYHRAKMCYNFLKGRCNKGKGCNFAHSQDELRRLGEARHEACLSFEA